MNSKHQNFLNQNQNPDLNEAELIWLALNQAGWTDSERLAHSDANVIGERLAASMRITPRY